MNSLFVRTKSIVTKSFKYGAELFNGKLTFNKGSGESELLRFLLDCLSSSSNIPFFYNFDVPTLTRTAVNYFYAPPYVTTRPQDLTLIKIHRVK